MPVVRQQLSKKEKFVNHVMIHGKKTIALAIVDGAFEILKAKGEKHPEQTFEQAIENVAPVLEIKAKRVGGSVYQVPMEVKPARRMTLAMRWIIDAARKSKGRSMEERLAHELLQAAKGEGSAVKKRDDTHRMAEANKAYAHYK